MLAIVFLFVPYLLTFQKYYILLFKSFTCLLSQICPSFPLGLHSSCVMLTGGFPISKLLKCPVSTVWPGLSFFLMRAIISQIHTRPGGKKFKSSLFLASSSSTSNFAIASQSVVSVSSELVAHSFCNARESGPKPSQFFCVNVPSCL